jgi:hypothetical protein
VANLWDELRQRDRWLLVYDNAQGPRELASYPPPDGAGRVVVTSRAPTWGRGTATVRLDVLKREESVAFLRLRTGINDAVSLGALAEALGDLPLALEQAAAYLDETPHYPGRLPGALPGARRGTVGVWGAVDHRADGGDHLAGCPGRARR